ncbi:MAG TPA: hypothetical protein QGF04_05180 [Woeseiaceae bacterium]|nr:hypothetical protein [Woeseiaceae bacterium]
MGKKVHQELLDRSKNTHINLFRLFQHNGIITIVPSEYDLFTYMLKLVCSQQLSTKAAETIWQRINLLAKKNKQNLMSLSHDDMKDELKSCGLSNNKLKAIISLRSAFNNNKISENLIKTATHDQIDVIVSNLWGFGPWSAAMIAMFYCCLTDIWSDKDLILKRRLTKIAELETTTEKKLLEHYAPYRTYLALHIWKGNNSGII